MQRIILARHGQPDFPVGAHLCLGRTDLPLSPIGRMQAALLDAELRSLKLKAVFLEYKFTETLQQRGLDAVAPESFCDIFGHHRLLAFIDGKIHQPLVELGKRAYHSGYVGKPQEACARNAWQLPLGVCCITALCKDGELALIVF